MIAKGVRLRVARIPLARIVITEHQPRYPARVTHYVALLSDPANAEADPGVVAVEPLAEAPGFYGLLDGHHRVLAAHIVGRSDLLALIHEAADAPEEVA
jgi:ParB-like chromosome segregation protein Spo0J